MKWTMEPNELVTIWTRKILLFFFQISKQLDTIRPEVEFNVNWNELFTFSNNLSGANWKSG